MRYASMMDRLLANSVAIQYDGVQGECWVWIGKINARGYGHITVRPKLPKKSLKSRSPRNLMAHRVAYEVFRGEILPNAMTLDHTCECPACINPGHHQPVTRKRNSELRWERKRA